MWIGRIGIDYNGFVLFDLEVVQCHYGAKLAEGTDLFTRYITTEEGDEVLKVGLMVPVLGIDDSEYTVVVRDHDEIFVPPGRVLFETGIYPLRIAHRLVLGDLAVLREWSSVDHGDLLDVPHAPGTFAVTVRGFCHRAGERLIDSGYEFVLRRTDGLPTLTADTRLKMGVQWA